MQGTSYGRDNFLGMDNLRHESSVESSCHKFDLHSEVFVSIGGGNVLSLKYLRVSLFNFGTFELQTCLLIFARERHSHVIHL